MQNKEVNYQYVPIKPTVTNTCPGCLSYYSWWSSVSWNT